MSQNSFAQNDTVYISGKVTIEDVFNHKEIVLNAIVKLRTPNGTIVETKSNNLGYYYIKAVLQDSVGALSIATDKNVLFEKSKSYGCLPSKDLFILHFKEKKKIEKDFELQRIKPCLNFPSIYFKQNSTEAIQNKNADSIYNFNSKPDEAIKKIVDDLTNNPEIVIEVKGTASSKELNKLEISESRAEWVRTELIKNGIDIARVYCHGEGYSVRLVKDSDLKKNLTTTEKELLHAQNRRVYIRIVSWDFVPK